MLQTEVRNVGYKVFRLVQPALYMWILSTPFTGSLAFVDAIAKKQSA